MPRSRADRRHWFWKLVDGMTPDQQIIYLVLFYFITRYILPAVAICAGLYAIWRML